MQSTRAPWVLAFLAAIALVASACGGDNDFERLVEEASGGDVDIEDLDFDDDGFSAIVDGNEITFGGQGRPDWVPGWIDIPGDAQIFNSGQDLESGESVLAGWLPTDTDIAAVIEATRADAERQGYVIDETFTSGLGAGFAAEHPTEGGLLVTISETEAGAMYSLVIDEGGDIFDAASDADAGVDALDEATDAGAGAIPTFEQTPGVLTLAKPDGDVMVEGVCSFDGSFGDFFSEQTGTSLAMDDGEFGFITGGIILEGGLQLWLLLPGEDDHEYEVGDNTLSYRGPAAGPDGNPVNVTVSVVCG